MRILFALIVAGLVLCLQSPVRGALAAGDVAIVAVNSSGSDDFAWVALTNIAAGTTLNFTDSQMLTPCFHSLSPSTEHNSVRINNSTENKRMSGNVK